MKSTKKVAALSKSKSISGWHHKLKIGGKFDKLITIPVDPKCNLAGILMILDTYIYNLCVK